MMFWEHVNSTWTWKLIQPVSNKIQLIFQYLR